MELRAEQLTQTADSSLPLTDERREVPFMARPGILLSPMSFYSALALSKNLNSSRKYFPIDSGSLA